MFSFMYDYKTTAYCKDNKVGKKLSYIWSNTVTDPESSVFHTKSKQVEVPILQNKLWGLPPNTELL
jgi:hypothetical protein